MPTCRRKTLSGAVLEIEQYTIPDNIVNIKRSTPKIRKDLTPEEKAEHNRQKSEKHFIRIINTNFTSSAYYVTHTYDDEHLPVNYDEAVKIINKYSRRLKYSNPDARIIAVTGYGIISGRLHHHLIIDGVAESDILNKWIHGKVSKAEHLREHNYYNGIDHGEDFTDLACYLHRHTPPEHKGKRWYQTKNLQKPNQKPAKEVKTAYSEKNPPKAPKGYIFVESYRCTYYVSSYIRFKYVREVQKPLNIIPQFHFKS